jgi:hypothetical protein
LDAALNNSLSSILPDELIATITEIIEYTDYKTGNAVKE